MIGWDDVYKVVVSMFPLYVALLLGYGSVKWWRLFTYEQCNGINRFIALFILPLFGFDFTAHMNPFAMNFHLLAADALSKVATLAILALWGKFSSRASYSWCIMMFSLCTLTNLLVVGVPVIGAMYGPWGVDLVVQLCMLQSVVWIPLLLLFLEFRKMRMMDLAASSSPPLENNGVVDGERDIETSVADISAGGDDHHEKRSYWSFIKVVCMKMALNPNVYANVLGLAWALLASRFKFPMPSIMEGSVEIMSKAGTGTAMFNVGIFIAMQTKVMACGTGPTVLGMVSRFAVGPVVMALCSLAVGLRGPALRVAIIQAALPQAIASFVFANEYGLHANVLSTAVVFGTVISLPLLIGYYIALEYAA